MKILAAFGSVFVITVALMLLVGGDNLDRVDFVVLPLAAGGSAALIVSAVGRARTRA